MHDIVVMELSPSVAVINGRSVCERCKCKACFKKKGTIEMLGYAGTFVLIDFAFP